MVFISITRLKVRSVLYILHFILANKASVKELTKTKGFLGGKELVDKNLTFWTLTMWESDGCMKTFRNSTSHRKAMQKLPLWCSEASYFHWMQAEEILPAFKIAAEKLLKDGKLTKVRNPSTRQVSNSFPQIQWSKLERNFRPYLSS